MRSKRATVLILITAGAISFCASAAVAAPAAPAAGTWTAVISTGGGPLNVRADAATDRALLRQLPNGATVTLSCRSYGENITGPGGADPTWYRLTGGGTVAGAYLGWTGTIPDLPWCGEPPAGAGVPTVNAPGGDLNVRAAATTSAAIVSRLPNGTRLTPACRVWGQTIDGNAVWNQLGPGRYVTDAYLTWSPARPRYPWCGQEPPTVPAVGTAAFLARVAGPARDSARVTRVPASVTLAQAILESGWGRSRLTRLDHSYFGMKCFGGPGPNAIGCSSYATHECGAKGCYATRAGFRAYRSLAESFVDHGQQLATLSRYAVAMRYTGDPDRFAREIHKAGYATAPTYADSLISLMRQYDLYQYDQAP